MRGAWSRGGDVCQTVECQVIVPVRRCGPRPPRRLCSSKTRTNTYTAHGHGHMDGKCSTYLARISLSDGVLSARRSPSDAISTGTGAGACYYTVPCCHRRLKSRAPAASSFAWAGRSLTHRLASCRPLASLLSCLVAGGTRYMCAATAMLPPLCCHRYAATTSTSAQFCQTCAVSSQSILQPTTYLPGLSSLGTTTRSAIMPSVQSPEHQPQ